MEGKNVFVILLCISWVPTDSTRALFPLGLFWCIGPHILKIYIRKKQSFSNCTFWASGRTDSTEYWYWCVGLMINEDYIVVWSVLSYICDKDFQSIIHTYIYSPLRERGGYIYISQKGYYNYFCTRLDYQYTVQQRQKQKNSM